jgi:hypothetical protein
VDKGGSCRSWFKAGKFSVDGTGEKAFRGVEVRKCMFKEMTDLGKALIGEACVAISKVSLHLLHRWHVMRAWGSVDGDACGGLCVISPKRGPCELSGV